MENYADAAGRHWGDGLLLERESRLENADQLYGIAAECAIKAALVASAGNCASNGLAKAYKAHIDELWDKVSANAIPRHLAALPPLLKMDNPYSDWKIDQRYARNGTVTADALERHKMMAKRLVSAVGVVGTRTK